MTGRDDVREHQLEMTRVFQAGIDQVYAAWTDPVLLGTWMGTRVEADVRIGGAYRAETDHGGGTFVAKGKYLALERNRRIVMSFLAGPKEPVTEGNPYTDEMIEVTFHDLGNQRTEVTLRNGWNGEGMDAAGIAGAKEGWGVWFDALGVALERLK